MDRNMLYSAPRMRDLSMGQTCPVLVGSVAEMTGIHTDGQEVVEYDALDDDFGFEWE